MGKLDGRGVLGVTHYAVGGSASLDEIKESVLRYTYNEERIPTSGYLPATVNEEDNEIEVINGEPNCLPIRFAYDSERKDLVRGLPAETVARLPPRTRYKVTEDDFIICDGINKTGFLLTISDSKISFMDHSCFSQPCFTDIETTFIANPEICRIGTDLLLWLVYICKRKDGDITDSCKIRTIENIQSFSEGEISYKRPSSENLREVLVTIAEKRPVSKLGMLISFKGKTYDFTLNEYGQTEIVVRNSAYEDEENMARRRLLIIFDLYYQLIPFLKKEYEQQLDTWPSERDQFREWCEDNL